LHARAAGDAHGVLDKGVMKDHPTSGQRIQMWRSDALAAVHPQGIVPLLVCGDEYDIGTWILGHLCDLSFLAGLVTLLSRSQASLHYLSFASGYMILDLL